MRNFLGSLVSRVAVTKPPETFGYFQNKVSENHRGHRVTQRGRKMKITTLCDLLCSLWFNIPYHNRILRKSEKVHATRIIREPLFNAAHAMESDHDDALLKELFSL